MDDGILPRPRAPRDFPVRTPMTRFSLCAGLALALALPLASAATEAIPTIAYDSFRLDNGLTVLVHTDRKAPIVAVNLWYHVGSKNERPGKTGFAHLFEHLMFQGSENFNDEYFKPFEQVGATDQNGTTSFDRTNYFQNVPTTALDMALWLESDRMGHLLGVIDQARLDEQRGVVKNEKRQNENQPYGKVWERLFEASYPEGHPYRWMPIGSMQDLDAASLEDVKHWFETYYGPDNTVLVLAGDIDLATAKEKVQHYFSDIAPGPALTRPGVSIAPRSDSRRDSMVDRVAQPRVYRSYNVPEFGSEDAALLDLAATVLGGGKTSRLYRRLVYRDQIADSAAVFNWSQEIGGLFITQADVKRSSAPAVVESAIAEEFARFLADGPSVEELERAKTTIRAGFIRGIERIGGFGGKADVLAQCQVFRADPACYHTELERLAAATPTTVRDAARRWLAAGDYTLTVLPRPALTQAKTGIDRSKGLPTVERFPDLAFPELERARLSNGIPIVLAQRSEVPVVQLQMLFDAGYAADAGGKLGRASFAMGMLDEGAGKRDALELAARAESLGAQVGAGASVDSAVVSLSALTDRLDDSLALYADLIRRPQFEADDLERVRKLWLAQIAQEKTQPVSIALRLLPPLLYGEAHAYGVPLTGSGTESSIASLTRADLVGFHRDWIRPDNASLIVVGDTTLDQIVPLLEKHFGDWRAPATARPGKQVAAVELPLAERIFLVDRPEAPQSYVIGGHVIPSSRAPNLLEIETMNAVFGGLFTARLNMNLREDKHWAYGSYSTTLGAQHQRPWVAYASVETPRTVDSLTELRRELADYVGARPATSEEIAKIKVNDVRSLPGQFETAGAVLGAIGSILLYDRPDDYVATLRARTEAQTDAGVRAAAREVLKPGAMTWVIVGDLSKIEAPVRALGIGEVKVMDADGKVLR
jgi:predicted Zn-dependent peptidase